MSSPSSNIVAFPFAQLPLVTSAIIIGLLSTLYLAWQWALPKPLPGIPYNAAALKSILGDVVEIRQVKKDGGVVRTWFGQQNIRHNSPMTQVFITPLGKPAVVLSDFREIQDILLRRSKEFDKGGRVLQSFRGVIYNHHIGMPSSDPHFKRNRELVKDLMTPKFLNEVSAPEIYENTLKFINLWRLKAKAANGHPFEARQDIYAMAFDIIKNVALGKREGQSLIGDHMSSLQSSAQPAKVQDLDKDAVYSFPKLEEDEDLLAHETQQEAIAASLSSPSPLIFHKINNLTATMRNAYGQKDKLMNQAIAIAARDAEDGHEVRSAVEYIIRREIGVAKKAQRAPDFSSPHIKDELYGYIGAGHETSSTTFQWAVKYLASHREVQTKLRKVLEDAFPEASREGQQPSVADLIKTQVPYLDAVVEEIVRLAAPVRTVARLAKVDTVILGHHIPKGTQVLMSINGPDFTSKGFPVDEGVRSQSSQAHEGRVGYWKVGEENNFKPERWMKSEDGEQRFDPQAGPILTFSTGPRGCYGRRLAYLQMRIVITLLIWNLEVLSLPEKLNTSGLMDGFTMKPVTCFVRLAEVSR